MKCGEIEQGIKKTRSLPAKIAIMVWPENTCFGTGDHQYTIVIQKVGDKYRSFLHDDTENTTQWRHGGPPNFDTVNQLFEEGRTKEWPEGSLEVVQNAIKTWDMEIEHKTRVQDSIRPSTLTHSSSLLMVDESMRAEDVEIYYDPAELIGGLLISPSQSEPEDNTVNTATATHGCPFSKKK
ncbi:PREDICTED: pathogen-related protein-like [Populus euphratica]|uniref:Pathogen-related protein-like n=1 Tax=Populus euphratica TaxID=75702 RepID=A0AAJ6X767_POPEU|nr:PREDICTED: pathogen-related protein-like [Populus euphratica]